MFEYSVKQYPRIREEILKLRQIKLQEEEKELLRIYSRELGYKFIESKIPLIGINGRSMNIQRENRDTLIAVAEIPQWDKENIVGSIIVKEDLTAALGWYDMIRKVNKELFANLIMRHVQRVPIEKSNILHHPTDPVLTENSNITLNLMCGLRFLEGYNINIEVSF